jgi:uncharacterized protein YbjQ (UPF0145 family)
MCVLALAACTPSSQTTRVMLPGQAPKVAPEIEIVTSVPAGASAMGEMSAVSCTRAVGMPPPSAEDALTNLKIEAASKGATGLANVTYKQFGMDLGKNCWATITATATAFR